MAACAALLLVMLLTCAGAARDDRLRHQPAVAVAAHVAAAAPAGGNHLGDALTLSLKGLEEAVACPNCLYKHHAKDEGGGHSGSRGVQPPADTLRLEAIKRQILSKLGLRHKPNVTLAEFPREIIMETLFRAEDGNTAHEHDTQPTANQQPSASSSANQDTVDADDFYGRTSEIISFAEQGVRVNGNRLVEFRVSAESSGAAGGQEFRVRSATLWLKADVRHARTTTKCRSAELYVFKFLAALPRSVKINSKEFSELTEDPVAIQLEETAAGWQKVDVTRIVRGWLETHSNNGGAGDRLRLFVDCACCSNWQVRLFNNHLDAAHIGSGSAHPDPDRPFLVVHTDPTTAKRVRRRALDCGADSGNACCKQRFYVSFKELGWDDWIIAPQGYYANYCRGDCGHHRAPDAYATYHTHVIEEVRKTHHLSGMQPCCAPLKFSSMSLIYFGPDSNIIKRDLPKMVVDECGCP